jgi:STE24 endopeptidase
MNSYATIILAALVGEYLLGIVARLLNLGRLRPELPAEFEGIQDGEKYARSQEYTRARTRFTLVEQSFSLAALLIFWFASGFNAVDMMIAGWEMGPIWSGLFFFGILALGRTVLDLPFDIYATFVIEERFGFNRTTPATFVADKLKGLALALVLGGPLLAGILWFFGSAGAMAWLYCWAAVTLFLLAVSFVIPTWIMPLFNRFTPLEEGELKEAILSYARSVNFAIANLFVIDGSKRSAKANAFFSGFGRNKRVALYDTLVEKHPVEELVAVVAHEVGHYKLKHIVKGIVISVVHTGALFFLMSRFIDDPMLFEAFGMERMSIHAGLLFFLLLLSPIELLVSVLRQIISRRHEFEADRFAADTTGRAETMIAALKRLSASNLDNLTPHPFYVFLYYSHPPMLRRIEALRTAGK